MGINKKLNESQIQKIIFYFTEKQGKIAWAHNIYLYLSESDFISISKNYFVYEYEIKTSISDFRADFKKKAKHNLYSKTHTNTRLTRNCPNYFYYVCQNGIIPASEIPPYAGLIYVTPSSFKTIKKAPRLHSKKISTKFVFKIIRSLSFRFYKAAFNL